MVNPTSTPGKKHTRCHLIMNNNWGYVKVIINDSNILVSVLDNFVDNVGIFTTGYMRIFLFDSSDLLWVCDSSN